MAVTVPVPIFITSNDEVVVLNCCNLQIWGRIQPVPTSMFVTVKREIKNCTRNTYSPVKILCHIPVMMLFHIPVMILFILWIRTWMIVPTTLLQRLLLSRCRLLRSWSSSWCWCFRDSRYAVIGLPLLVLSESEGSMSLPSLPTSYLPLKKCHYGIETCKIVWNHDPFIHHVSHHHHAFGGCCGLSYKQLKTKAEQFQDQVLVIRRCCRNFNMWDSTLFCFVALGLVLLGDISLSSSNILYNYNSSTTLLMQFYKIRFE